VKWNGKQKQGVWIAGGRGGGRGKTYALFEEAAGVQQIVQAAFGLGRLEVAGGLDPFTVW
jgi:hypothetical protein